MPVWSVTRSTLSAFQLIEREKDDSLPYLEALARVYFPPLSIAEGNGLKAFFQDLVSFPESDYRCRYMGLLKDGQSLCKRAIPCGADYECIVRRLLQAIGDRAFATPGLNMDTFVRISSIL